MCGVRVCPSLCVCVRVCVCVRACVRVRARTVRGVCVLLEDGLDTCAGAHLLDPALSQRLCLLHDRHRQRLAQHPPVKRKRQCPSVSSRAEKRREEVCVCACVCACVCVCVEGTAAVALSAAVPGAPPRACRPWAAWPAQSPCGCRSWQKEGRRTNAWKESERGGGSMTSGNCGIRLKRGKKGKKERERRVWGKGRERRKEHTHTHTHTHKTHTHHNT